MDQPLYLITDGGRLRKQGILVERIAAALEGAAGRVCYVQLREQIPPEPAADSEILELARILQPRCNEYNARLIVNRRHDLLASGLFHGTHLGAYGSTIADARAARADAVVGYSAHSVPEALSAFDQGADYVFLSPIFRTASKELPGEPLGLEPLNQLCVRGCGVVYALGGIDEQNARKCREMGAGGVAVLAAVLLNDRPHVRAETLLRAWDGEAPP